MLSHDRKKFFSSIPGHCGIAHIFFPVAGCGYHPSCGRSNNSYLTFPWRLLSCDIAHRGFFCVGYAEGTWFSRGCRGFFSSCSFRGSPSFAGKGQSLCSPVCGIDHISCRTVPGDDHSIGGRPSILLRFSSNADPDGSCCRLLSCVPPSRDIVSCCGHSVFYSIGILRGTLRIFPPVDPCAGHGPCGSRCISKGYPGTLLWAYDTDHNGFSSDFSLM